MDCNSHYKRETCRLCESTNVELVMDFVPTPVGDHYVTAGQLSGPQNFYPLDLYFCLKCHHLQLLDVVNPEIIYRDYLYETSVSLDLQAHFQNYANSMVRKLDLKMGSFVVEIGCNDGSFLKCFKAQQMRVLGIEPATKIAQKLSSTGIDVLPQFFNHHLAEEIVKEKGSADLIVANNVMANIDDLGNFARGIKKLLAPQGAFLFESGYMVNLIKNKVVDNVYHEHLSYFSVRPLISFFQKYELEMIDVEFVNTKGGSIRGIVQHKNGPRKATQSLTQFIKQELDDSFDKFQTYRSFAKYGEDVRANLQKLVKELKGKGKKLAGYGASVGVTTLLYYFGLEKHIDCLFDDNSLKFNTFGPGHHYPVFPSQEIYNQRPDYIILLAWRYAQPIMKRHPDFIKEGGKFIIPLPQLTIS